MTPAFFSLQESIDCQQGSVIEKHLTRIYIFNSREAPYEGTLSEKKRI